MFNGVKCFYVQKKATFPFPNISISFPKQETEKLFFFIFLKLFF